VQLTPSELAAAHQALSNLSGSGNSASGLLTGSGTDTFAGGVAGSARFLSGFRADTVTGGKATTTATAKGLALYSNQVKVAGPTASGVKGQDTVASHTGGQLITLNDHSTINLIGVSAHNVPKAQ
jgi:hypothetical protein